MARKSYIWSRLYITLEKHNDNDVLNRDAVTANAKTEIKIIVC